MKKIIEIKGTDYSSPEYDGCGNTTMATLIINEDSDMDDQTKPQTVALAKKKKKKSEDKSEK